MNEMDKFTPFPKNVGKPCMFWDERCYYPKAEIDWLGWRECKGIIGAKCVVLNRDLYVAAREELVRGSTEIPTETITGINQDAIDFLQNFDGD